MRVTDLAYSLVYEPPTPPPEAPPPDGAPPAGPQNSASQSAGTSPSVDSSASLAAPETTGSAQTPQHMLGELSSYGPPQWARPSFTHGFPGSAFTLQPDGTLRCPAGHPLSMQERRPERNGSLRVLYAARIGHCRPCPLREQCQESGTTCKPRRVSAVFWPPTSPPDATGAPAAAGEADASPDPPLPVPAQPVRWGDWPRCQIRRTFVQLLRTQTVLITFRAAETVTHETEHPPPPANRAQRAHWRLSWEQRLARNARPPTAPSLEITLHGLPAPFIQSCGLPVRQAA
jgi:hypothetical protein